MPGPGLMQPGFNDPVLDSQQVFKAALKSLTNPGLVIDLPVLPPSPEPLYPGTAALLLTLLDLDTLVWLDPEADTPEVADWLAFHCGCPLTADPGKAAFAVISDGRNLPGLELFSVGAEDSPEQSATVIIQVGELIRDRGRSLSGPGIEDRIDLKVLGLADLFWEFFNRNGGLFPQGLDFLLTGPGRICGLPRTTKVVS